MQEACIDEIQKFLATGDYNMLHAAWPGRRVLERIHAGDAALRVALADALSQRTKGLTFPSLPPGFESLLAGKTECNPSFAEKARARWQQQVGSRPEAEPAQ